MRELTPSWLCSQMCQSWRLVRSQNSSASAMLDRKSTRLNSSHQIISYAVFCLKKKKRLILTAISKTNQSLSRCTLIAGDIVDELMNADVSRHCGRIDTISGLAPTSNMRRDDVF